MAQRNKLLERKMMERAKNAKRPGPINKFPSKRLPNKILPSKRLPGKRYWFVRKSYGWGWTPATREGWYVLIAHIALIIIWADVVLKDKTTDASATLLFVTIVMVQSCILVLIAYKTGEPPAWTWGKK